MKVFCWIFILSAILGVSPLRLSAQGTNASKSTLRNQDIVDMTKTGLPPEIIVAKIRNSSSQFDTSTAALKDLKAAGVSDSVILAMVDPAGKPAEQSGPAESPKGNTGFAYVRVYRPKLLPGSNFNPPIYVDDKEIFKIGNARRCSVKVSPGSHTVTSDDKSSMIQIDAKGGQEFFVSVQELPGGFLKGKGKLTLVANEQGRPEYKLEKPLEDEKKVAKDMIEDDAETPAP